jgi:uroporphyrinogen-III synthase
MGAITLEHLRPRPYIGQELRLRVSIGHLVGAELRLLDLEDEESELALELETRKLSERGKGILERELGLREQEARLALEHQSQEKKAS